MQKTWDFIEILGLGLAVLLLVAFICGLMGCTVPTVLTAPDCVEMKYYFTPIIECEEGCFYVTGDPEGYCECNNAVWHLE